MVIISSYIHGKELIQFLYNINHIFMYWFTLCCASARIIGRWHPVTFLKTVFVRFHPKFILIKQLWLEISLIWNWIHTLSFFSWNKINFKRDTKASWRYISESTTPLLLAILIDVSLYRVFFATYCWNGDHLLYAMSTYFTYFCTTSFTYTSSNSTLILMNYYSWSITYLVVLTWTFFDVWVRTCLDFTFCTLHA